MTDPTHIIDPPLPPEIAERMETAGFSPKVATLMEIIENFARLQAEARAKADRATNPAEEMWPLKSLLPIGVKYEQARRAADSSRLAAEKIGGRWFCTKLAVARWLAATGRRQRR
jgi:hypothetical protein